MRSGIPWLEPEGDGASALSDGSKDLDPFWRRADCAAAAGAFGGWNGDSFDYEGNPTQGPQEKENGDGPW